jgi:hypothetical protein
MTAVTPQALLGRVRSEFDRRRWRDVDQAALNIVRAIESAGGAGHIPSLAKIPSSAFLAQNDASRDDVKDVLRRALDGITLALPSPALIPIEAIDSFSAAGRVTSKSVASVAAPGLPIPERKVKEYIANIIGEPYLDTDWGGELSDILTSRVTLSGQRITGAFLLKGSGANRKLRPKDLGTNGDQIRRLSTQDADLYVVQHVGEFDEAVRDELRDMVLARRAEGFGHVVGSIWDGSDCARLFIAHGLIDASTGLPLS